MFFWLMAARIGPPWIWTDVRMLMILAIASCLFGHPGGDMALSPGPRTVGTLAENFSLD
jgi:hypothetical protein